MNLKQLRDESGIKAYRIAEKLAKYRKVKRNSWKKYKRN